MKRGDAETRRKAKNDSQQIAPVFLRVSAFISRLSIRTARKPGWISTLSHSDRNHMPRHTMQTAPTTDIPIPSVFPRITRLVAILLVSGAACRSSAEDWGAYSLVPVSAQAMVLEAAGSGADEGTVISIGKPAGTANQKWVIVPKIGGVFAIKPTSNAALALAVAHGEMKNSIMEVHTQQLRVIAGTWEKG